MRTPSQYFALLRQMGPAWVLYRIVHAVQRRSGLLRRATPAMPWEQMQSPSLALQARNHPLVAVAWGDACVNEAEKILAGKFRLFSHREVAAGFPPAWHRNWLFSGTASEADQPVPLKHWTEISDASRSDIKGVWELSRFSWAFPLVRAYARTDDQRFAEAFWRLFRDWCDTNPPNLGPNWMCGQEATFRLMAVVFAAENLGVPDVERTRLARFVVATGRRIATHLAYALSQDNNHGISECVGLITAGLLLPEEKEAANWLVRGSRHLEAQLKRLVYDDGGFSQHSLVYHRVLLHDLCWARWRFDLSQRPSPEWLDETARRALAYLLALTDTGTGEVALFGSNDGANILPLSDTDFMDMRPVIQLTSALFRNELSEPPGKWDEAVAWTKPDWRVLPRISRTVFAAWHAPTSGCFKIQSDQGCLFLRCPTHFEHRPAQADMLHVDVWYHGRPVAMDGGSFSYNSTERFKVLGAAAHHNVLTVDGREPIEKFSRFLYLPWPEGSAALMENGVFRCSHNGYEKLGVTWIREVSVNASGGFLVRDLVRGAAGHRLRWHWRLADAAWRDDGENTVRARIADFDYKISWSCPVAGRSRLVRADESSAYGWWAPYYGAVLPATALLLDIDAAGDIECSTEFKPVL
jgi:hypothetical protein